MLEKLLFEGFLELDLNPILNDGCSLKQEIHKRKMPHFSVQLCSFKVQNFVLSVCVYQILIPRVRDKL